MTADTEKWKARARELGRAFAAILDREDVKPPLRLQAWDDIDKAAAAALAEAAAEREAYLIWSNDHMAWWRPNGAGYTIQLEKAGRYTRADAVARSRVRDQEPGKPLPEIPIRECDVLDILVPAPAAIRAREQKPHD